MDWEVLLYYSRDDWKQAADALYDILDSLTANLEKPLDTETKHVDAIVEKIMSATRPENEEGEGLGIQKIVTLKNLDRGVTYASISTWTILPDHQRGQLD